MKKLLVGTAAIALGLALAAPAQAASGVKLGVGGYFKGYLSWLDQDEPAGTDVKSFDILRDTEVHFTGETTLDNGLTVGFNTELLDDQGDGFAVQESYAYFSGAWGRVNLGAEDGAAYLLQVAAPSADSNVDGLRKYVDGVSYANLTAAGGGAQDDDFTLADLFTAGNIAANDTITVHAADGGGDDVNFGNGVAAFIARVNTTFDYDNALSGFNDKITYLTPVFSGFQAGVSFAPNTDNASDQFGHPLDNTAGTYDNVWDASARWEGMFSNVGIAIGGGYSHANLQADAANPIIAYVDANNGNTYDAGEEIATIDDRKVWNAGLDLNWGAFGLGGAYLKDNLGISDHFDRKTWVVGGDYTTGPYKLGVSYYDETQDVATQQFETTRWTAGAIYTYGPGMTFRGSVSWMDLDESVGGPSNAATNSANATNFLLGTQIDF
jgi:hypothetical protein